MDEIEPYIKFGDRVRHSRGLLKDTLCDFKEQGKKIVSAGATSKSTVVFNYCDIGPDLIRYITDTTPEKIGKLSPGKHIPIRDEKEKLNDTVDVAFLGAWNFKDKIIERNWGKHYLWVTHVPEVQII
jgi:methylation protein EvaC